MTRVVAKKTTADDPATEDRIFAAARDVFYEQGFDGARMQVIAQRAGINHSMLHYYFRTKGRLFDAVFRRAALEVLPPIMGTLTGSGPLMARLERFVDQYLEMIDANPHMPAFIITELRRNPSALRELVGAAAGGLFERLQADIAAAVRRKEIRPVRAEDLFANLMGLCVFPILARPMLQTLFSMEDAEYDSFLGARPAAVRAVLNQAMTP